MANTPAAPAAGSAAITKAAPKHLTVRDYENVAKHRGDKARSLAEFLAEPTRRARLVRLSQNTINIDQLVEIALASISKTPMIAACTLESLALALQDAAELGILPSGTLGLAHLVPFQNRKKAEALKVPELYEAKLIPDYKGLAHLARESGSVLAISAGVIYRPVMVNGKQVVHVYDFEEGSNDRCVVKPIPYEHTQQDADLIYAWAACKIPANTPVGYVTQWTYVTRAEVLKIKASSRAASSGPWVTWEAEMWKKTAVKRLSKLAPRRGKFARAVEIDDAAEAEPELLEVNPTPAKRKGSRAEQLLASLPAKEGPTLEATAEDVVNAGAELQAGDSAQTSFLDPTGEGVQTSREPTDEEIEAERAARKK